MRFGRKSLSAGRAGSMKSAGKRTAFRALCLAGFFCLARITSQAQQPPVEDDHVIRDFRFKSGEMLPELRLHYRTFGTPARDAQGRTTNAVLILHGTGGSGNNFMNADFAGVLFGPGQLLDAARYFIVIPDSIGNGRSSKPSDGLRMKFPRFEYDDAVALQHKLLTEHLGVNHLRLIIGTSMGCMHSWVWGYTHPDFMDALMPLACLPTEVSGLNRMRRQAMQDVIRNDPEWNAGNYTSQPRTGLRAAIYLSFMVTGSQLQLQKRYPTREAADKFLEEYINREMARRDANDVLYQYNSSRNYNPSPHLGKITAQVLFINSADDIINPPELGIAEREIKKVKNGRFILLPTTDETRGHGTHSQPKIWGKYLEELLKATER